MADNPIGAQIITDTKAQTEALNKSFDNYNTILDGLLRRQNDLNTSGQTTSKYYEQVSNLITKYNTKLIDAALGIDNLSKAIKTQEALMAAAQDRAEFFGKAYDGVAKKVKGLGDATDYMGKIIGSAAKNFEPLTSGLKNAITTIEPFKKGIGEANNMLANYRANLAEGQTRLQAFGNSSDGTKKLFAAFEGGTGSLKTFKVALAETGIGLIVILVAALTEKLQSIKPVMDQINAVAAAMGAVMSTLANSVISLFTHPIDTIKNFGGSMADAAKEAYELSLAQEKLKTALSGQEVANARLQDQIDLLKQQADNTKLSTAERQKALTQQHQLEQTYYTQNKQLADQAMENAIKDAKIKGTLNADEVANLHAKGTAYAQTLLESGRIDQEQFDAIKKADLDLIKMNGEFSKTTQTFLDSQQKLKDEALEKDKERQTHEAELQKQRKDARDKELDEIKTFVAEAEDARTNSIARMAKLVMSNYDREVTETQEHYSSLLKKFADYTAEYQKISAKNPAYAKLHFKENQSAQEAIVQLEKEKNDALLRLSDKFMDDDLSKLNGYQKELEKIAGNAGENTKELALQQIQDKYKSENDVIEKAEADSEKRKRELIQKQLNTKDQQNKEYADKLQASINNEKKITADADILKINLLKQQKAEEQKVIDDFNQKAIDDEKKQANDKQKRLEETKIGEINQSEQGGHHIKALEQQKQLLDMQYAAAIAAAKKQGQKTADIELDYAKKKAAAEDQLTTAKIHAGDKYINAVLANTKKDSAIYKAAFLAKKATSIADVIISTKKGIIGSFEGYAHLPFIGQALAIVQAALIAGQGASSIAEIAKQKPGFAQGGQFVSDGRGALLSGYSRTDNTNAYLRSGEAVVVSEAMRNPWARNLVSAINVAHGGRDFSAPNTGRGYAVGGIFTDGGNANRYYSQPVNDVKDLANTLAYQMINNFPPIYVDVKDVNNQQNILAQTVNRVNL